MQKVGISICFCDIAVVFCVCVGQNSSIFLQTMTVEGDATMTNGVSHDEEDMDGVDKNNEFNNSIEADGENEDTDNAAPTNTTSSTDEQDENETTQDDNEEEEEGEEEGNAAVAVEDEGTEELANNTDVHKPQDADEEEDEPFPPPRSTLEEPTERASMLTLDDPPPSEDQEDPKDWNGPALTLDDDPPPESAAMEEERTERAALTLDDPPSNNEADEQVLEEEESAENESSPPLDKEIDEQVPDEEALTLDDPPPPSPPKEPAALNLPPMEHYRTISDKERNQIHAKLKAYETRRKMTYSNKLESSSLYWRAFKSLLGSSILETSRAERLVSGAAKANKAFADAMRASYEDTFLDDKGLIVTDPKKQKRLLDMRSQQDYVGAPRNPEVKKKAQELEERRKNSNNLSAVIDTQAVMATKFGENAQSLQTEIASEISVLRNDLITKVQSMRVVGDQILAELERVNSEVSVAWGKKNTLFCACVVVSVESNECASCRPSDAYYSSAVEMLNGSGLVKPKGVGRSPSNAAVNEEDVADNTNDVWLVEMHYRVAVSYQTTAWVKGSSELTKLFASMKDTECQRRLDLREYLVAFMQRQERLFTSLPDLHTPVLQELVERDMDRSALEANVQAAIRKRAEKLQRESMKNKSKEGSQAVEKEKKEENDDGDFVLGSPLLSELCCTVRVIERKNFGMMSSWKLCMAVITTDGFLHMFDVPAGRVSKGSAPEVAFEALTPVVNVPSSETVKAGKSNFIKGWCDNLTPAETLNLMNCRLVFGFDAKTLDVQETTITTGASKVFGKTTKRKMSLKLLSKQDAQDFMFAVNQAQGELD